MSTLIEQKSMLAKLLATENVHIEHSKITTALFDPVKRVLYLPIWKDMTGFMYDHLCGHEVGHALYTPAEGWHKAAANDERKNYKAFLNVVEDIRIEKKVQRKYPGLRRQFIQGFGELMKRDFFGIGDRNINSFPFIDRLNIYSKSQYEANIDFTEEEYKLIERAKSLETWDQVIAFVNELYEYSKEEQEQMMEYEDEFTYVIPDDFDEFEEIDEEGQNKNNSLKSLDEENNFDSEHSGDEINRDKTSQWTNIKTPDCVTDNNYRRNEFFLLDEKCKEYKYYNIPTPNLKDIITPYKIVHKGMETLYNSVDYIRMGNEEIRNFKNKNEKYISLLAKEFEMRKAANAYSKSKISETGDINISKLASYKFDDNLFNKIVKVPKGKSHGLILLLDCSGSMSDNMAGSIEQILVLTMFCRKVNIPFTVYGFGNHSTVYGIDCKLKKLQNDNDNYYYFNNFSNNHNDLVISGVMLREYLNSKMSNAEFTRCLRNMILLKRSYELNGSYIERPMSEMLSNTPLLNAVIALAPVMKEFKKRNNLDITNLVIVHDGDSDNCTSYYDHNSGSVENNEIKCRGISSYDAVNFVIDKTNKFQHKIKDFRDIFTVCLKWFTHVTGSKIFGFYIIPSRYQARNVIKHKYYDKNKETFFKKDFYARNETVDGKTIHDYLSIFTKEKFIVSYNPGYEHFYFISGGKDILTENDTIEVNGKVTSSKLKTAFMKMSKKKQISRVLVSKFISGISV